jgi:pilus assembly protein CpaB
MRIGTITLVLGAAACAAAAALLTKSWLAANTARPAVAVVGERIEKADVRTVIVASRPLAFGTKLSADAVQETQWPATSVPDGTFASKDALLGAGGERVVLSAIAKNEPILASKITAPGQRASLSVVIAEGKKAVTIRVDDVLGVAGFVQPDDRVDILLTRSGRATAQTGAGESSAYTDVLLQDIRVLAIDQLADRNSQAKPAKAVTVEVDTADAQKLVLAASVGQLSLALRRAGWSQMGEAQRIGIEDLLKAKSAAAPAAERPVVTVTRATERKQYEVQSEEGSAEPQEVQSQESGSAVQEAPQEVREVEPQPGASTVEEVPPQESSAAAEEGPAAAFGRPRAVVELPAGIVEPAAGPQ